MLYGVSNRVAFAALTGTVAVWALNGCGNPASWSFATTQPKEADLIRVYAGQWILNNVDCTEWKPSNVELREHGVAVLQDIPLLLDSDSEWALEKGTEPPRFTGNGTWTVESTGDGYFAVLVVSGEFRTRLTVWHDGPPHKLWIQTGDPDSGTGLLFRPVETESNRGGK